MKLNRREFLQGSATLLAAGALASVPRGARADLPKAELLGSYWTFAGGALPHSDKEYATFEFRDRAEALGKAGFTGMGLWHADLEKCLEKYTLKEMRSIFRDNGLKNVELEFLTDWFQDGGKKKASDERRRLLLNAAETFGARHVKVGDFDNSKVEMPKLIDAWAALCRDGANHGTRILFELMPFSMLTSLKDTLTMLDGAGAENGGIMFDFWHIEKLKIPHAELQAVPLKYILGVEMNDGYRHPPAEWSLLEETIHHRKFCGIGEFNVRGMLSALAVAGYHGPYGIEVLAADVRPLPLAEVVRTAFTTTMAEIDCDCRARLES
ncbi:MAG: sugar phosphate isomerase/epimerase family protein [Steroidobacterales bacterium]